jgi:hypothetical protein
MQQLSSLAAVGAVILVPIFLRRIAASKPLQSSSWLSFAGGISVAYVFMYILPKLAAKHAVLIRATDTGLFGFLEHHAYFVALMGFLLFYGIEHIGKWGHQNPKLNWNRHTLHLVFDVQVAGFAAYNVLLGYLIVRQWAPGILSTVLFTLAVQTHFLGIDFGLWREHPRAYDRVIRWVFAGCLVLGWTIGQLVLVSEPALALWFAFLAGSITVIVIAEEFPEKEHARFWPFFVGTVSYCALLLAIEAIQKMG